MARKMTPEQRDAQRKAVRQFEKESYDKILVRVSKKDGKRDLIKQHAEDMGESVNGFIVRAIDETIERDQKEAGKP